MCTVDFGTKADTIIFNRERPLRWVHEIVIRFDRESDIFGPFWNIVNNNSNMMIMTIIMISLFR